MTEELPIACSLDADGLADRLRHLASIGAAYLISREAEGPVQVLRFRRDDEVLRSLEAVVAAESECCSFLEMEIRRDGGELVLTIGAPAGAEEVAAGLAAAFSRA